MKGEYYKTKLGDRIEKELTNSDEMNILDDASTKAIGKRLRVVFLEGLNRGDFDDGLKDCAKTWLKTIANPKEDWFWEDFGNDMSKKLLRPLLEKRIAKCLRALK